ncbi:hypothetical protein CROQUDRAFT_58329 [Cronartium quercuum f. sp. fusiforme G11]|uniref:Ribosomal protein S21 n=1 Tax=Cronartium quercuum f. sp. fusiforme G11 TaxID=708437 RepID=A0A9P6TG42_9BASI|nr:hypothetical protein CROQUDRAFT_58329 [Cronartium quercuum f. sp. fusiforme G11]
MALANVVTKFKSNLPPSSLITIKTASSIQPISLPSTLRCFSFASTLRSTNDPFGFAQPSKGASLKLRKPTSSSSLPKSLNPKPSVAQVAPSSPSPVGSAIFQRIAQSRHNQIQELKRFDEANQPNRDEKATPDVLWASASQLKVQSHSGPLTPSSSRVVRTLRIPPSSFLNRPATSMDVERAYKRVQFMLNSAGLRKDLYLNKRYEKPYLKRRRLRSERHRTKFAIEVQRRVQIISVMKLKGM